MWTNVSEVLADAVAHGPVSCKEEINLVAAILRPSLISLRNRVEMKRKIFHKDGASNVVDRMVAAVNLLLPGPLRKCRGTVDGDMNPTQ